MGFSTVLIISLAAGVILIVGGGLMMYMANLVKSAYEIKVQIGTEVEERLTKMADDLDKKSKWIKRDLLEEIDKIKVAIQTDNSRRLEEFVGPIVARINHFEEFLLNERSEWVKAIEADRAAIATLEARVKTAPRARTADAAKPAATATEAAAAALDGAQPASPAPEPEPKRNAPSPVSNFLQELR